MLVDYRDLTAERAVADTAEAITEAEALVAQAVASADHPSFEATMRPLDLAWGRIAEGWGRAAFLSQVATDPAVRDAGQAADELDAIAASFDCPSLTARAACARGAVSLAAGDAAEALRSLRGGWQLWQQLGARYDAARARTLIGLAFRALGDDDSALSELAVARRTFHDLEARDDVRRVDSLLTPTFPDRLTGREVEVLRLVAAGRTNAQIAGTLFLSEKTVARHLSNIFGKIDVSSRTAAAAYAIEHELV